MTSGLLLALAAHALTGRFGIGIISLWQELFPTDAHALHAAFGWWIIAGAGFAGSFCAGLLARYDATRPRRGRQWLTAGVLFLVLAAAPYLDVSAASHDPRFALGVNLAVFALGTVTAFCGSWFSLQR
jgi:hypothetical protein